MLYYTAYATYVASILATSQWINSNVPLPYMDEPFHIPQAQAYCRGEWRVWDPLLTTPPGLYLIPSIPARFLPSHLAMALCSTPGLRFINTLALLLLPLLYSHLFTVIRSSSPLSPSSPSTAKSPSNDSDSGSDSKGEAAKWEGFALSLFPVLGMFGFLFYTDLISVILVLASYAYSRHFRPNYFVSALLGALSLLFRQTNIAWIAFIAGSALVAKLETRSLREPSSTSISSSRLYNPPLSTLSLLETCRNLPAVLDVIGAYLPVFLGAIAFVIWNGGIVLGDKSNHVPEVHIPQVFYFLAFTGAFLSPVLLSPSAVKEALRDLLGGVRRTVVTVVVLGVIVWSIKHYTIAHPFLLSDNRHYAFYVWRRILNPHPLARYALAPGYLLAGKLLFDRLAKSQTIKLIPFLLYVLALSLTLIPTPLLEPRYFLTPFLLLRLHLYPVASGGGGVGGGSERRRRVGLEAVGYGLVLMVTMGVFGEYSFKWEGGEEGEMRFMW